MAPMEPVASFTCVHCHVEQPLDAFQTLRPGQQHPSWCKACKAEAERARRRADPARNRTITRAWGLAHSEALAAIRQRAAERRRVQRARPEDASARTERQRAQQAAQARDPAATRAAARAAYQGNLDVRRAKAAAYTRARRAAHKESRPVS